MPSKQNRNKVDRFKILPEMTPGTARQRLHSKQSAKYTSQTRYGFRWGPEDYDKEMLQLKLT